MDSRGAVRLWMLLLVAAGCQHQTGNVPSPGPLSPNIAPPKTIDPSQIKKVSNKPKELPPQVLVADADYKTGEAQAVEATPQQQQQLWELAHQEYDRALKVDPKYVPAYRGLARLYTVMQEHGQAVETYQKALRIEPKNGSLWYDLAMCHNTHKDWNAALDCLQKAAKIDPNNRNYSNAQGVILAKAGRYDESLSCFARTHGDAMGCYRLAQTLDRLQQPGMSRYYMEAALRKDPNIASSLNPPVQQASYRDAAYQDPNVAVPTPMPEADSSPTPVIVNSSPARGTPPSMRESDSTPTIVNASPARGASHPLPPPPPIGE